MNLWKNLKKKSHKVKMEIEKLITDLNNLQKNKVQFFKLVFGKENIDVGKLMDEIDFLRKVSESTTLHKKLL
jgi:hypothetical protein